MKVEVCGPVSVASKMEDIGHGLPISTGKPDWCCLERMKISNEAVETIFWAIVSIRRDNTVSGVGS